MYASWIDKSPGSGPLIGITLSAAFLSDGFRSKGINQLILPGS